MTDTKEAPVLLTSQDAQEIIKLIEVACAFSDIPFQQQDETVAALRAIASGSAVVVDARPVAWRFMFPNGEWFAVTERPSWADKPPFGMLCEPLYVGGKP